MARLVLLILLPALAWASWDPSTMSPEIRAAMIPEALRGFANETHPTKSSSAAPLFIGGAEADISQFPYLVAIEGFFAWDDGSGGIASDFLFACMGTIIDPSVVLTGANCLFPMNAAFPIFLRVRAGSNSPSEGGEVRNVIKHKRHETFNGMYAATSSPPSISVWTWDDVSLMFLDSPLPVGQGNIQQIQIADQSFIPQAADCVAAGWAFSAFELLEAAALSVISNEQCNDMMVEPFVRDDVHYCTFDYEANAMCLNWGVPLVCSVAGQAPTLVAVSSFPRVLAPYLCDNRDPYSWARINGPLKDWVEESIFNAYDGK